MKRYKPTLTAGTTNEFPNGWVPYMAEQDDGEWVKWEDVKALQAAYDRWVDKKEPECSCAVMFEALVNPTGSSDMNASWVCPAHGYKKL